MLSYPNFVRIQVEDGSWLNLKAQDTNSWVDIIDTTTKAEIYLSPNETGFDVQLVQAPCKVKGVQLTWQVATNLTSEFLGDAFERGYGDLGFKKLDPDQKYYWYFIKKSQQELTGWGVKTNAKALCCWQVTDETVDLWLDLRSGTKALDLEGRSISCASLVYVEDLEEVDSFKFAVAFCQLMMKHRVKKIPPIYGGNDWYAAYGKSSAALLIEMADSLKKMSRGLSIPPYLVVDDGWQVSRSPDYNGGPWETSNSEFTDMPKLAKQIKARGVRPGLWFRPLLAKKSALLTKEMILREEGEDSVILDPSHPAVLQLISEDIRRFGTWGFELIKHDFSTVDLFQQWGFEMAGDYFKGETQFFDSSKTTGEIVNQFYATIQAAAGEMVLIGCNTIGHLAAGIFQVQRTGDDTSGRDFSRTRKMGVNTLAFRMPQNQVFYACDADCVGITSQIAWESNQKWLAVLAKSGTPLFVSFTPEEITEAQEMELRVAFKTVVATEEQAQPLDWEQQRYPRVWQSQSGLDDYQWYTTPREFEFKEGDKE